MISRGYLFIKKMLLVIILVASFWIGKSFVLAEENFSYSDAIVDNLASVIASETGCGQKDYFVYQMIWGGVYMNNYNRLVGINTPITLTTMCNVFSSPGLYTSTYCNYTFDKLASNRGGACSQSQMDQLRLAAKMVLGKSFTIPKNVYMAAEASVVNAYGKSWVSFTPTGGWTVYYAYQNTESLATTDIYGNTVNTDEKFYHDLADCLYTNPKYGAYNQCSADDDNNDEDDNNDDDDNIVDTLNEFLVTFMMNDGSNNIYYSKKVTENSQVTAPSNPKRDGYSFDGWMTSDGNKYNFSSLVTSDINLYAKWVLNEKSPVTILDGGGENPKTGTFGAFILLVLGIMSLFGVSYYYKYFNTVQNDKNHT